MISTESDGVRECQQDQNCDGASCCSDQADIKVDVQAAGREKPAEIEVYQGNDVQKIFIEAGVYHVCHGAELGSYRENDGAGNPNADYSAWLADRCL